MIMLLVHDLATLAKSLVFQTTPFNQTSPGCMYLASFPTRVKLTNGSQGIVWGFEMLGYINFIWILVTGIC